MKQFETVPIKVPAKNVFNLSHDVKSTYNFDKLYPFLCHPVYPGDTFNCRAEVFLRAMPMLSPVMHNVDMKFYFFFVPMRLLWNEKRKRDWKVFITGGEDGKSGATDSLPMVQLPYFTIGDLSDGAASIKMLSKDGNLFDHMGFPSINKQLTPQNVSQVTKDLRICSLPFRAYQLVYNEYFRNQNVQNEVEFSFDEGHETSTDLIELLTIRKKCWEKDYFTSCLPFAQRGEAVTLPITIPEDGELPVKVTDATLVGYTEGHWPVAADSSNPSALNQMYVNKSTGAALNGNLELLGTASIGADELSFTGFSIGTINDFRYCLRLQQWLENNARCGSRYIEQLLAHFGVVSSDARLQRPELLGGGKIPLIFTDVEQTSFGNGQIESDDVIGNLAGKGTLYGKTQGFKKYFEEHGILLGICCIIPRTSYSQGIPRYWTAFDKTDWYFPEFANLGEQAVLNKELYVRLENDQDALQEPEGVFGYQGRFTELRYIPSSVHGEFRNDLSYWHLGRLFTTPPALNDEFVSADSRVNVFAMEDIVHAGYDPFVCQIHLDIKAVRPLPKYAVPTL